MRIGTDFTTALPIKIRYMDARGHFPSTKIHVKIKGVCFLSVRILLKHRFSNDLADMNNSRFHRLTNLNPELWCPVIELATHIYIKMCHLRDIRRDCSC